jgi:hypothetical protein
VRNDGTWVQGVPMVTPRVEPAAVIVRDRELLVLGGQSDATQPALEHYSLDGSVATDRRAQRTGDADLDARTGAPLVRVGDMAYALGGARVGATVLAPKADTTVTITTTAAASVVVGAASASSVVDAVAEADDDLQGVQVATIDFGTRTGAIYNVVSDVLQDGGAGAEKHVATTVVWITDP